MNSVTVNAVEPIELFHAFLGFVFILGFIDYCRKLFPKKFYLPEDWETIKAFNLNEALQFKKSLDEFQKYDKSYLLAHNFITKYGNEIMIEVNRMYEALILFDSYAKCTHPFVDIDFYTIDILDIKNKVKIYSFEDVYNAMNNFNQIKYSVVNYLEENCPEKLNEFNKLYNNSLDGQCVLLVKDLNNFHAIHLYSQDVLLVKELNKHWKILMLFNQNCHNIDIRINELLKVEI